MKILLYLSLLLNLLFFLFILIGIYNIKRRELYQTAYQYKGTQTKTVSLPTGNNALIRKVDLSDLLDIDMPLFDMSADVVQQITETADKRTDDEIKTIACLKGCVQPRLVLENPKPGEEMLLSEFDKRDRIFLADEILIWSGLWKRETKKK